MTHDELLAEIDERSRVCKIDSPAWSALRAIVEIHKGYNDGQVRVNEEFNQGILALSNVLKEAIEKELK